MSARQTDTLPDAALLLAAHGDRGDRKRNRWLLAHVEALRAAGRFRAVSAGVLKGEPLLEDALAGCVAGGPVLLYPLFMSDGYFMRVLRRRIAEAGAPAPVRVLAPLGADTRLPGLILERALAAAGKQGFKARATRLLVVGHGSKFGPANAEATRRACVALAAGGGFSRVEAAFLEEAPFLRDALTGTRGPTVVAGYFCGEGMHAEGDVPSAIAETGAQAVYTGAVGADPAVPDLILGAIVEACVKSA